MANFTKFGKYWFFSALAIMDLLYATTNNLTLLNTKVRCNEETEMPASKKLCSRKNYDENLSGLSWEEEIEYLFIDPAQSSTLVQREAESKECASGKEQIDIIENPRIDEQIIDRDGVANRLIEKYSADTKGKMTLVNLPPGKLLIDHLEACSGINPYELTNMEFLFIMLYYPSPKLTAEVILTRFTPMFLNFLYVGEFIAVLKMVLSEMLGLNKANKKSIIGLLFGRIDYSQKIHLNSEQISSIVAAMMESNVPECFEEVYLSWRMWVEFKPEEQDAMLKNDNLSKEISLMLYLFVLNKNGPNSAKCDKFRNDFVVKFAKLEDSGEKLLGEVIKNKKEVIEMFNTFSEHLIYLPEVLQSNITDIRSHFIHEKSRRTTAFGPRYRMHVSYAFTKYVIFADNASTLDRIYFDYTYFKNYFRKQEPPIFEEEDKTEQDNTNILRNVCAAVRQIAHNTTYNPDTFYKLLSKITKERYKHDGAYLCMLFYMSNKAVFGNDASVPDKIDGILQYERKNKTIKRSYKFMYVRFLYNLNLVNIDKFGKIRGSFIKRVLETRKFILQPKTEDKRAQYLWDWVIYHPEFRVYKENIILGYFFDLIGHGRLKEDEHGKQFARDLVSNNYYHEEAKNSLDYMDDSMKWLKGMLEYEFEIYEMDRNIEDFLKKS